MANPTPNPHHVVIVRGGFGGLYAAQSPRRAVVQVTLIDRRNFHLFQPLLYQVATGALSPANIAAPLRSVLRRQKNVRVLLAEVCGFDLARRCVLTSGGSVPYDSLVVVGSGPTGVELAGALAEIGSNTLRHDFRSIKPQDSQIVEFQNRLLVLFQWAWNYITWKRAARLITGENHLPLPQADPLQPDAAARTGVGQGP